LIAELVKTEGKHTLYTIFPRAESKDVVTGNAASIMSEEEAMPGSAHGLQSVSSPGLNQEPDIAVRSAALLWLRQIVRHIS